MPGLACHCGLLMSGLHQRLEVIAGAVARLDGIRERRVVAPRAVTRELERRHQLDRADAQVAQVRQATADALERAWPAVHTVGERAHVQLVDDQVVPSGRMELGVAPVEQARVHHDRIAHRRGQAARAGVDAAALLAGATDQEPVLVTRVRARDVHRPMAGSVGGHGGAARLPAVEGAGDRDGLGVGRPDTEGDAAGVRDRAHAGALGRGRGRAHAEISGGVPERAYGGRLTARFHRHRGNLTSPCHGDASDCRP